MSPPSDCSGGVQDDAQTATRAGRTFAAAQKRSKPVRQPKGERTDLFDLTPTEEQRMLRDSVREFALAKLRPAAHDADDACAAPWSCWPSPTSSA